MTTADESIKEDDAISTCPCTDDDESNINALSIASSCSASATSSESLSLTCIAVANLAAVTITIAEYICTKFSYNWTWIWRIIILYEPVVGIGRCFLTFNLSTACNRSVWSPKILSAPVSSTIAFYVDVYSIAFLATVYWNRYFWKEI